MRSLCYLKLVKITKNNQDLLFSAKCPVCRNEEQKNVDEVDKNAVCAVLKKTYRATNNTDTDENKDLRYHLNQSEQHISTLNIELRDLRAELSLLRISKDAEIQQIKNLLSRSVENELNNLKKIIRRYDDDK